MNLSDDNMAMVFLGVTDVQWTQMYFLFNKLFYCKLQIFPLQ